MNYTYIKEITESLTACYEVNKDKNEIKSIYFIKDKKIVHSSPFSKTCIEIESLEIPAEFYDSRIDSEPYKIDSLGVDILICGKGIKIKKLIIANGISYISPHTFDFLSVEEVVFPDSIKEIPESCFEGHSELRRVHLPKTLTCIGACAFAKTESLESIEIPDSCELIETDAFCQSGISSIKMGKGIKSIKEEAFADCKNLTNAIWPSSCEIVPERCFYGCKNMSDIVFEGNITNVECMAFYFTNVKRFNFSKSLTCPNVSFTVAELDKDIEIIKPLYAS